MLRRTGALAVTLLALLPAAAFARAGSGSAGFHSSSLGGGSRSYGGGYGRGYGRGYGHHFFFFGGGGGGGGGLVLIVVVIVLVVVFSRIRRRRRWPGR